MSPCRPCSWRVAPRFPRMSGDEPVHHVPCANHSKVSPVSGDEPGGIWNAVKGGLFSPCERGRAVLADWRSGS